MVVRQAGVRYVISLTGKDVYDLHVARKAIEREAPVFAAANINAENRAALYACLQALEEAMNSEDRQLSAKCDMAFHQMICDQANNKQCDMDPQNEHHALVKTIVDGDAIEAARTVEAHLDNALIGELATFRI